jgi:hypothetical protein
MKSLYISSTRKDLGEYLLAVTEALRNCGYSVDAMEKYPARDDRPKAASEADAAACDIYVGIFAWKYGHVPVEDNPDGKSITELEYLAAGRASKPRLVFLLADDAAWPSSLRDAEREPDAGVRIRDLRKHLKSERWAAFFTTPDNLAKQVLTSVFQYEATKRIEDTGAIDSVRAAAEFGPSYLANIQQQIEQSEGFEFVALRLGPKPWWNTRLHLAAALASDFTETKGFVLLDAERRFLTMAAPGEIRRAFAKSLPTLELAYLESRTMAAGTPAPGGELDRIVNLYPAAVIKIFATPTEESIKQVITPAALRELGIKPNGEVMEQYGGERRPRLNAEILRRPSPYVVLLRDGAVEGVVDRAELASRIARTALA